MSYPNVSQGALKAFEDDVKRRAAVKLRDKLLGSTHEQALVALRQVATFRPLHEHQQHFIGSPAKRKVVRAGRRGGKTVGAAQLAGRAFQDNKRVLYAAPTAEQVGAFWFEIKRIFETAIDREIIRKNETEHILEIPKTKTAIRAKTAWNADTLRGDYGDLLILDEWQLMNEDAWGLVGAPMLADHDGDAVFIYTPPSLRSRSASKANDPQHAAKLYRQASLDTTGRWQAFHFTSRDNPFISQQAVEDLANDMTALAYRMEILAEDIDEAPGALWTRANIEQHRHKDKLPDFDRVVIGIDPSATSTGDEAGIVAAGRFGDHLYILEDASLQGSPQAWATAAIALANKWDADRLIAESNNGGEMVSQVLYQVDPEARVELVHASRGKATRAEPVAALYEQGRGHHCGSFPALEDEMALWTPGAPSPNRMDALVWAATSLMLGRSSKLAIGRNPFYG